MRVIPYLTMAKRIVDANLRRPDFPFKLTFAITYWCNYKCKTCNIWLKKPKDELSAAEIDTFFQRSNRFSWVDLTGGEVSLRKDFPAICESLVRHNRNLLLLHFATNGYLTDRILEQVKEILKTRPPRLMITVSMDGDEALNDEIRGVDGGYQRQMETFRRLRAIKGVQVVLGMTLSKLNADKYPQTLAAAQREVPGLHPQELHMNIVHESDHYFDNAENKLRDLDQGTPERLVDEVERHAWRRTRLPWHPVEYLERAYLARVRQYIQTGETPMRCHALRSSCFIDSWGQVFPCTIYNLPLGSLRDHEYRLEDIWKKDRTKQIQGEIWENQCPQCWTPCEAYPSIMGNFLSLDSLKPLVHRPQPRTTESAGTAAVQPPAHSRPAVQLPIVELQTTGVSSPDFDASAPGAADE